MLEGAKNSDEEEGVTGPVTDLVQHTPQRGALDIPELRDKIHQLEKAMKACPDDIRIDMLDVMHHFTDGIYCRTVLMHAGELIVGKIHKKEHIVVVSAGRASVISEEFGGTEIVAPMVFKSPPGVKRVLHIHEDMVWTTIHKNESNTENMDELEEQLIAKEYEEIREEKEVKS